MLAYYQTLSGSYLRERWSRAFLIVVSIALGVATLVGSRALHSSLRQSAKNAMNPLSGVADLLVVNGQTGVPYELATKIRAAKVPGVKGVEPTVLARVGSTDLPSRSITLLGVDLQEDKIKGALSKDSRWGMKISWTATPSSLLSMTLSGHRPVLVTPQVADELARQQGDASKEDYLPLHIFLGGEKRTLGIAGTVQLEGSAQVLGSHVVFMDRLNASPFVYPQRPDFVSQITIQLEPGASRDEVRGQLQQVVGREYSSAQVQTIEAYDEQLLDVTAGLEIGFLLGSVGALIVGVFLVYNAMSVSVAERRHDIGILRSVGATRSQIALLFVGEAFLLGLIGSACGVPLGYGLARLAVGPMSRLASEVFVPMDSQSIQVPLNAILIALGAGVGTAILAALVPGLQAAQEEPANAVRRVPVVVRVIYRILQISVSVILVGIGLVFVILRDRLPVRFGAFAGVSLLMLGSLVATPLLAAFLGRLLLPVFRRTMGISGRLAADNLVRSPGRTGLVIAALAATTALVIQTAGFIRSTKVALLGWIEESIAADLFVTSGDTISRLGQAIPMSREMRQQLTDLEGVQAALPVRFHRLDFRDRMIFMLAIDPHTFEGADFAHPLARSLERYPRLAEPGTALVSENFSALYHIDVGDRFTIPGRKEPIELEVIGKVVDYSWNRGTILVHQNWYRDQFADNRIDVLDVYLKPGADPEQVKQTILDRYHKSDNILVETRKEFCTGLSWQLDRVYSFAYAQELVIGMVSLLGVISALFISILQRRRELGLLRAVGASRAQILRSVLAEAGLMGLIGAIIGLTVGVVLEWYILKILILDEAGFLFPMQIPWIEMGAVLTLSVLLPILVGIWPAMQATRLRIADAIAYE